MRHSAAPCLATLRTADGCERICLKWGSFGKKNFATVVKRNTNNEQFALGPT